MVYISRLSTSALNYLRIPISGISAVLLMCFRQLSSLNLKVDELSKRLDGVSCQKLDSPSHLQFEVLENADNLRDFVVQLAEPTFRQSVVSLWFACTKKSVCNN